MKNFSFSLYSIFCALLIGTFAGCESPGTPKVGDKAPEFLAEDLEGNAFRLSTYRGKLVMLYFWADNCDICKKEFPVIQDYYERLKVENFELLAIYIGTDKEATRTFRENFQVTFPMLIDDTGFVLNVYNINASPTNYLVNPDGTIVKRVVGFMDELQVKSLLFNLQKVQE
jgi:peroxiredoxin